jgi:hypothetical protein
MVVEVTGGIMLAGAMVKVSTRLKPGMYVAGISGKTVQVTGAPGTKLVAGTSGKGNTSVLGWEELVR